MSSRAEVRDFHFDDLRAMDIRPELKASVGLVLANEKFVRTDGAQTLFLDGEPAMCWGLVGRKAWCVVRRQALPFWVLRCIRHEVRRFTERHSDVVAEVRTNDWKALKFARWCGFKVIECADFTIP